MIGAVARPLLWRAIGRTGRGADPSLARGSAPFFCLRFSQRRGRNALRRIV